MTQSRGLKSVALVVALSLAVVGLSQCRMVEDNIAGVDLDMHGAVTDRAECVQACNDAYKAAERAEDLRFDAAVRSCGKDQACIARETDRTKANHAQNVTDMQDCKRACYNEGSGNGGR